ncbi:hypothetical protein CLH_2766 [Clostridium botulinum E3 str. Alaska E43]|nr:hypothetical protein CLH_2766 [Clostridium botulinum E3 str. Alaska E43]
MRYYLKTLILVLEIKNKFIKKYALFYDIEEMEKKVKGN